MYISKSINLCCSTSGRAGEELAGAVLTGLSKKTKTLPSGFLYDDQGSRIFQEIMGMPEYYPTNSEAEILENNSREIAGMIPRKPFRLIELGAGDGKKTRIVLNALLTEMREFTYEPIDISSAAIGQLIVSLQQFESTHLEVRPVIADYFAGLDHVNPDKMTRNVILFLGSNIGNMTPEETELFLFRLRYHLNDDDLMIVGMDLKKDEQILQLAYDDPNGITGRFNLNLLRRINRELDANFNVEQFRHSACYNKRLSRMESRLVSKCRQTVTIPMLNRSFAFERDEAIFTEISRKFTIAGIGKLAGENGFEVEAHFLDEKRYFSTFIWRVVKPDRL